MAAKWFFFIKPQFEAGKQALNKKGIVKDRKDHVRVITELLGRFRAEGLAAEKITISPVKGGDGNLEYLILLKNADMTATSGSASGSDTPHTKVPPRSTKRSVRL